jgi:DNA-binding protein H-NS
MALPKIDKLSLEDLKKLQKQVAKAIDGFEKRRRKEALAVVEAKAKEFGFTLSDLTGKAKSKPRPSPPRYRHPENAALTWSGRGRQPAWIKDGLQAGKALEDYAIK